jgi:hypothetical protein
MRRVFFWLSGLLALAGSFLATGSPAFAMRIDPPAGGPSAGFSPVVHHSAGLGVWPVVVIVVASLVVVGAATLGRAFIRRSSRPAATAAAT